MCICVPKTEGSSPEIAKMGENKDLDSAEAQLLIERIEVASEIVRSSQAAVAFQRAFYLEVLTFDRVENEVHFLLSPLILSIPRLFTYP